MDGPDIQLEKRVRQTSPVESPRQLQRKTKASIYKPFDDEPGEFVYTPCRVSFGPYYHGDDSCRQTEQRKGESLRYFLERSKKTVPSCVEALSPVVEDLKDAYDQLDRKWRDDTEGFLKMMILDGCFLIEVLRAATVFNTGDHRRKNPVFGVDGIHGIGKKYYRHDMLLLGNQLPMLLLLKLISVETGNDSLMEAGGHVNKLVAWFFSNLDLPTSDDQGIHCLHILHLYRQCLINKVLVRPTDSSRHKMETVYRLEVPSATQLHKVGIEFTVSKTRSIMDISFERETLSLPKMFLDDLTKSRFLNIIAFEQLHTDAGHDFMSYLFFMFRLIQGPDDFSLLQLDGVIDTSLERDEVVRLLNFLIRRYHTTMLSPEHHVVGRKLRARYDKMSTEWRLDLFQKYLRSPWAIISVVAAVLLFIFTAVQAVFTVLSFFYRN